MNRLLWFITFSALLIGSLVMLASSRLWLPDMVATKFSVGGDAEGFTPCNHYLALLLGLTVGMPILLVAAVRIAATHALVLIDVPHREHWFAAERRAATVSFLTLHVVRFGCALVLFFATLHGLTLQANLHVPPRLPMSAATAPLALFAVALVAWTIVLRKHFSAPG